MKTVGLDVSLNRRGDTGVTLLDFCDETMTFAELEEKSFNENTDKSKTNNSNYIPKI